MLGNVSYPRLILLVHERLEEVKHGLKTRGCVDVMESFLPERRCLLPQHCHLLHEARSHLKEVSHSHFGHVKHTQLASNCQVIVLNGQDVHDHVGNFHHLLNGDLVRIVGSRADQEDPWGTWSGHFRQREKYATLDHFTGW